MESYLILTDGKEILQELRELPDEVELYRIESELQADALIVQGTAERIEPPADQAPGLIPSWMPENYPRDWMVYFNQGKYEDFCQAAEAFFQQAEDLNVVDRDFLSRFQQDLLQELGFALKAVGVPLSRLLSGTEGMKQLRIATRSVPQMTAWLRNTVARAMVLTGAKSEVVDLVPQVRNYINLNIERRITREELSEHFHLSKGHIARRFHEEMGMSISDYINRQRISKACLLLWQSELSPGEVAARCGFNDYPYFYKTFRKLMGCSPSEYKQKRPHNPEDMEP